MKKDLHDTWLFADDVARVVLVCASVNPINAMNPSRLLPFLHRKACVLPRQSPRLQSHEGAVGKPGLLLPSLYLEYVLTILYPAKPMRKTATGAFLIICVGAYLFTDRFREATRFVFRLIMCSSWLTFPQAR